MAYKLIITEHAVELLDKLVYHLLYHLRNEQVAKHLLDEIDRIYDRLEDNPYQFPESKDTYLKKKGYREAIVTQMNYTVIFSINADYVDVVGVFHQLEEYRNKV